MPPVSETEPELGHGENLKKTDYLCPICLEIFLEPVTLPCSHTFCKPCFLETVDKANICCPLCRKRVSTWARLNGRNKTLVNVELWKRIQEAFPTHCERRLNGIDDDEEVNPLLPMPKVCQPGELRQEYEDQINKFVEEKRALEEAERRASEEYIQRLLAEEEERVAEERKRQEERQLKDDEILARLLSKELNSSPVSESQRNVKVIDATPAKKKKPCVGHIEKYLCQLPHAQPHIENKPSSSLLDNKENILNASATFSPSSNGLSSLEIPLQEYSENSISVFEPDATKQLSNAAHTSVSFKRKTVDNEQIEESDLYKRPCFSLPSSPLHEDLLQVHALREEAERSRLLQEEEDRRMAQRLQRELDRENAVNRRKGSVDGYLLRQKTSPSSTSSTSSSDEDKKCKAGIPAAQSFMGKAEGRAVASGKPEGKTPKKSPVSTQVSPFSAFSQQKGTKQTTLIEMFPNLGS
ncbi:E3 ubiquitin-protein ligase rnf168 [Trichomycterus rosablanca]|uniref:E3 ubiquitin-protein ligase rnf168 n=1 Tax=Trichomycterus rosablanca TaxID=2290929 RepID=UPI002F360EB4